MKKNKLVWIVGPIPATRAASAITVVGALAMVGWLDSKKVTNYIVLECYEEK